MSKSIKILRYIFLAIQIIFLLLMLVTMLSSSYILPIINIILGSVGIFISSITVMKMFEDLKDRRLTFTTFGVAMGAIVMSMIIIVVKFVIGIT